MELGFSALTRRERLERIARAERDRRAGRVGVAIATLGEATEWPARVIMALARIPESEAIESRRILEEGLDVWARETGLDSLDAAISTVEVEPEEFVRVDGADDSDVADFAEEADIADTSLHRPIEVDELERAFAEAEAQTDEMHDANRVAERVLMDVSIGLLEDSEADVETGVEWNAFESEAVEVDAAQVESIALGPPTLGSPGRRASSNEIALATLERWLANLERNKQFRAGRAQ